MSSTTAGGAPATGRRSSRRPRTSWWAVAALLPFAAFVVIFAAYPMYELAKMSFSTVSVVNGVFTYELTGLRNYVESLSDPTAWNSIRVNIVFIITTVLGSLGLGVALAFIVDRSVLLHPVARNVLIWPAVVTPVVVSLVWLLLLSPTAGGLNKVLETFGLPGQSWLNTEGGALASAIAVDIWHWTPIVFLFTYTALKGINEDVIAAARVDGATESQIRRMIMLPMIKPTLVGLLLVRTVQGVKAFDEIFLLTRGGPNDATELISLYIRTIFFDSLQYGYASALSVLVVLATIVLAGAGIFMRRRTANRGA
jgi:multiple sugar transport system permease protein